MFPYQVAIAVGLGREQKGAFRTLERFLTRVRQEMTTEGGRPGEPPGTVGAVYLEGERDIENSGFHGDFLVSMVIKK